jgi:hypothetical protein
MNKTQYAELYVEASADLARLEAETENIRQLCNYLRTKAGDAANNNDSLHVRPVTPTKIRRFADFKQIDAAKIVLSEASEPLKTREIAKRVMDGGFPSQDLANLKTSLFTTMTRKADVFKKAGPGLWTLQVSET